MKRVMMPTLEKAGSHGGIGRYLQAIIVTYPHVTLVPLINGSYPTLFSFFWKTRRTAHEYLIHEILPVGTVAWLTRRAYVLFLHGMDFDLARRNPWKRWISRRILWGARAVVVNSESLRKEVQDFMGRGAVPPVHLIYPPVSDVLVEASKGTRKGKGWTDLRDLAKLAAGAIGMPIATTSRPLLTSGSGRPVYLLTVARLVERKGHLKVLEAMMMLPNTKYTIVGDGPMKQRIEERSKELGLESRVTILTDVADEDLPALYAQADIFVMPVTQSSTDREGFGIVYLEANLFGLPVVGTRTGGVAEAILDGKTGVLVEDTIDDLITALKTLIDSTELRSAMGSRGRVRVLEQFTREEQMGKLRPFIE